MMRCEKYTTERGINVRCLATEPHIEHLWQTPTQAVEETLRALFGENDIGVVWSRDQISSIHLNGRPLCCSEWSTCWSVGLPVTGWERGWKTAWQICTGEMFRCSECREVVPSSRGADDDMPDACDACWAKKRKSLVADEPYRIKTSLACSAQTAETVVRSLLKAVKEAAEMNPVACADDIVRHAAEILGFGLVGEHGGVKRSGATATCAEFRHADEQHGATLAAHCGTRLWEDMAEMSRRLWVERARRLRKRWMVDEMAERLNADTDGNLAPSVDVARLAKELQSTPEWRDATAGTATVDVALAWIRNRKKRLEQGAGVALAASKLVASWEQHGLSGIASSIYDLRAALEKIK